MRNRQVVTFKPLDDSQASFAAGLAPALHPAVLHPSTHCLQAAAGQLTTAFLCAVFLLFWSQIHTLTLRLRLSPLLAKR